MKDLIDVTDKMRSFLNEWFEETNDRDTKTQSYIAVLLKDLTTLEDIIEEDIDINDNFINKNNIDAIYYKWISKTGEVKFKESGALYVGLVSNIPNEYKEFLNKNEKREFVVIKIKK